MLNNHADMATIAAKIAADDPDCKTFSQDIADNEARVTALEAQLKNSVFKNEK
jgi:hypothetical protein